MESPSDDVYNGLEELISLDDELPDKPVNDDQVDQTQEINNDEELYNGENNGGLLTTPDGLLLGFRSNMEFGLSFDHNHVFATIPQTDQVDQIQKEPWTMEEEQILLEAQKEMKNKWVMIAKKFPGRTASNIKNRWNSMLRRKGHSRTQVPDELKNGRALLA
ncbi:SANT/Myb domain [Dillenia turbinata]|uniref:SANT/Myb domain n=1 Tax=Dillenia turbinata TaxID=194707 RepID=A0AAN8URM2_9MAGN